MTINSGKLKQMNKFFYHSSSHIYSLTSISPFLTVVVLQDDDYGNGYVGAFDRKGMGRTLKPGP